ncbi:hypothetical protein SDC9_153175 [bioreactor metagenome]|uniref:Uncharacterized protein n=1 Tax=bioreactor metagenome TaxID=1076179 RepID=A0A645EV62_9ZZZZ
MVALAVHALAHGAFERFVRPAANARLRIRRDVGAVDCTERAGDGQPACVHRAVGHGMAHRAIAHGRQQTALFDLLLRKAPCRRQRRWHDFGLMGQRKKSADQHDQQQQDDEKELLQCTHDGGLPVLLTCWPAVWSPPSRPECFSVPQAPGSA